MSRTLQATALDCSVDRQWRILLTGVETAQYTQTTPPKATGASYEPTEWYSREGECKVRCANLLRRLKRISPQYQQAYNHDFDMKDNTHHSFLLAVVYSRREARGSRP